MTPISDNRIKGVLAPVVTPFHKDLGVDKRAFVRQCRWLIANDVGLAVFGTNSEATSLSSGERQILLEALVEDGIPVARLMPGTGCCSMPETVSLVKHALTLGIRATLMLPPFYYKNVADDGLVDYFSRVIDGANDDRLRVYLYNFPSMSQVPISRDVVEALLRRYPGIVLGIKDSSGDWESTNGYISSFSKDGFDVFAGTEMLMRDTVRAGGAGCISATANVNPRALADLYDASAKGEGEKEDQAARKVRTVFQAYPMIPAMKRVIADSRSEPDWSLVRPPLMVLSEARCEQLKAQLSAIEFGRELNDLAAVAA
jgi:4-hydroxy-tetrahydrodipicolinate synthase